jgi:hypothetical protein
MITCPKKNVSRLSSTLLPSSLFLILASSLLPAPRVLAKDAAGFISTDLKACPEMPDPGDPNDTPYTVCPGVGGYALILRHSDSGRHSIDVLTPQKEQFPLVFSELITPHPFHLGDRAEWRLANKPGPKNPIALIVRIEAHEDPDEPQNVTRSYLAIAKITPPTICLTDKITAGSLSPAQLRRRADAAAKKACLSPAP